VSDGRKTNAGALVFGRRGSEFLVSATVTCALFRGTDKVKVLDQKVYERDIVSNYHDAITSTCSLTSIPSMSLGRRDTTVWSCPRQLCARRSSLPRSRPGLHSSTLADQLPKQDAFVFLEHPIGHLLSLSYEPLSEARLSVVVTYLRGIVARCFDNLPCISTNRTVLSNKVFHARSLGSSIIPA
jgi:hypothetical protein